MNTRLLQNVPLLFHMGGMSQRVVLTLQELLGHPGHIRVICACGHKGAFCKHDMLNHRKRMGHSLYWRDMEQSLRCSRCGKRRARAIFVHDESAPPDRCHTPSAGVPAGVNVRAFLAANDAERRKMVRRARG